MTSKFKMPTKEELELIAKAGEAATKAANKRAGELAKIDEPICPDEVLTE